MILSIDPGSRYTGMATKIGDVYNTFEIIDSHEAVWLYLLNLPWKLVLCENFTAMKISQYGLQTVRIIGGVEALCKEHGIPYMTHQNFERIKYKKQAAQMIIAAKGKMIRDHEQDALAHLLAHETQNG